MAIIPLRPTPPPPPETGNVVEGVRTMLEFRRQEKDRLALVHDYLHGRQKNPATPTGAPDDVIRLAKIARVNVMKIVVNSVTQALYVDGFRGVQDQDNAPPWRVWQANKMDRGQIGVHRAALAYGLSFVTVLPGDPEPVIRGFSPRFMTAAYGDDPDWPILALEAQVNGDKMLYRLYDDRAVHTVEGDSEDNLRFILSEEHDLGVTPVVRFLNEQDLDEDFEGEVEPLMVLQDQVDLTTFSLLVAQHYAAFRQRYIIGWTAESERQLLKASAARILTFDDNPEDVKVGEFEQTQLEGYLKSREESLKQAASISQTPVHELIGSLVNLSAEALVAAEAGQRRKVIERQTGFGESWESVFELCGLAGKFEVAKDAQVRWRDTESRALAATVDALGKMAQTLSIPPEVLWERIPGVTQQDVARWKEAYEKGSPLTQLQDMLANQTTVPTNTGGEEDPAPRGMRVERDGTGAIIGIRPA